MLKMRIEKTGCKVNTQRKVISALHDKIGQRKVEIEKIEMELGIIKASILRIECIN